MRIDLETNESYATAKDKINQIITEEFVGDMELKKKTKVTSDQDFIYLD